MSDSHTPKTGGLLGRLFGMSAENDEEKESLETPQPPPRPEVAPEAAEEDADEKAAPSPEETSEPAEEEGTPGLPFVPSMEIGSAPAEEVVSLEAVELAMTESAEAAEAMDFGEATGEVLPPEFESTPEEEAVDIAEENGEALTEELEPPEETAMAEEAPVATVPEAPPVDLAPCPACASPRRAGLDYCVDCGYMFPAASSAPALRTETTTSAARSVAMPDPKVRLRNRYEVGEMLSERQGICRYRGWDHGAGAPQPIVILWGPVGAVDDPVMEAVAVEDDDILPTFDEAVPVAAAAGGGTLAWPSIAWEKDLLERTAHPGLPTIVDHFIENDFEYLVEGVPAGRSLWDAWDEPEAADARIRYGWLRDVAQAMDALHRADAILEAIRPELVVVGADGKAAIADLSDLLPLPLPAYPPIKATLYTAPEIILTPLEADPRASLYSFGAMLYALEYLHHGLEEKDFERQFVPHQITDRNPDVHPVFFRLINKTFVRDVLGRFPTDESVKDDPGGFQELIRTLDVCGRTFDACHLDVAAWTTIGMVRTGNEDAFTFLHGVDARLDDRREYAMVLLADGMGGYDAGEVAAAMALDELRKYLLAQPMFAALTGGTAPDEDIDPAGYRQVLLAALKHANKEVFTASRTPGKGKRGMGCTAEAVYVDGRNIVVGHVGDSRTYHLSQGRLIQLTRDQTLVNRLVELGQLTPEEAEDHPRKNELQQAIGGQPDVNPGTYSAKLKRGDYVLVCSDGLTNHIPAADLEKMLGREAASAEEAARRLTNLVNLRGATDNSTLVVIRAT